MSWTWGGVDPTVADHKASALTEGSGNATTSECHSFSAKQIQDIIIIKSALGAAAAVMCLVGIIVIVALRQYRTFVHRLVLYLMVVALLQEVTTGIQVAPVHHTGKDVEIRHGLKGVCVAIGFAVQVTLSQLMLVLTWILIYLFLLVVFKYRAASKKHEIAGLVITLGLPFTFDWLPFIHNLYGLAGVWCWITVTDKNCHDLITLGLVFQNALFYGPKVLLVILCFVIFLIIVVTLCKRNCNRLEKDTDAQRSPYQQAVKEALPLVLYPILYNIIVGVMLANRIDYAVSVAHHQKPYYPLFLAHAIVDPLRIMFIPMAFLLHPGTVRKLLGRDQPKRSEDSETNYPVPPESFTEVDPLVIRGSGSGSINNYKSIFDSDTEPEQ